MANNVFPRFDDEFITCRRFYPSRGLSVVSSPPDISVFIQFWKPPHHVRLPA